MHSLPINVPRRPIVLIASVATLLFAAIARADAVMPAPDHCPTGFQPHMGHDGSYCMPEKNLEGCPVGYLPKIYGDEAYCEPPPSQLCPRGSKYRSAGSGRTFCTLDMPAPKSSPECTKIDQECDRASHQAPSAKDAGAGPSKEQCDECKTKRTCEGNRTNETVKLCSKYGVGNGRMVSTEVLSACTTDADCPKCDPSKERDCNNPYQCKSYHGCVDENEAKIETERMNAPKPASVPSPIRGGAGESGKGLFPSSGKGSSKGCSGIARCSVTPQAGFDGILLVVGAAALWFARMGTRKRESDSPAKT